MPASGEDTQAATYEAGVNGLVDKIDAAVNGSAVNGSAFTESPSRLLPKKKATMDRVSASAVFAAA